jgi:dTDP-4-amino-4,6-dideoxy-D-galactose acyltransferase
MSEPRLESLPWDSELFGFPVGRLSLGPGVSSAGLSALLDQGRRDGLHLVYCTVPWTDAAKRSALDATGARCVDRKVRYRKTFDPVRKTLDPILQPVCRLRSVRGLACGADLERLALLSGRYSRFRLDPRIDVSVYTTLYLTWIRRSMTGEIADEVLVICREGTSMAEGIPSAARARSQGASQAAGMVTLARSDSGLSADIGLIAVDTAAQGQGLGRRLMQGAEAWCLTQGVGRLEVVTQGENLPACALYESAGFVRAEEHAVYHCWLAP